MGKWRLPEKILLPAEPDRNGTFRHNGRLANGDQVMAYIASAVGETWPVTRPHTWLTAILFRFDPEGLLLSCEFASTAFGGSYAETSSEAGTRRAKELLASLVAPLADEGWVSADILVRLFYVRLDQVATGLVYRTSGEDEGEESEDSPEEVRLVPFDKIFHRPWTDGIYDT